MAGYFKQYIGIAALVLGLALNLGCGVKHSVKKHYVYKSAPGKNYVEDGFAYTAIGDTGYRFGVRIRTAPLINAEEAIWDALLVSHYGATGAHTFFRDKLAEIAGDDKTITLDEFNTAFRERFGNTRGLDREGLERMGK